MNRPIQSTPNTQNRSMGSKVKRLLSESLVNSDSITSYYEPLIQNFIPLWSPKKFRAQLFSISRLSNNVIQLSIKPSRRWKGFKPGQYIELTVEQNGALVTRCFSISSSISLWQSDGIIKLSIREQDQGRVTPWLIEHLKSGDYVQISEATGSFLFEDHSTPKLLIAGGTGITPIKSILSSLKVHSGKIDLIYFAPDVHLFKHELSEIADKSLNHSLTIHFIKTNEQGHFSRALLNKLCPDFQYRQIFMCGPSNMSVSITETLRDLGIDEQQITQEHFLPIRIHSTDSKVEANITFNNAGRHTEIKAEQEGTLLELAEKANLNPSYGCRMGVCHQCKCTKNKGVVLNTITGQVSDTGEEEIQLCVSVPLGDLEIEL